MCGILGFITSQPSEKHYKYLVELFEWSQNRGSDATGIAIMAEDGTIHVEKAAVDAFAFKETLAKLKPEIVKAKIVIGHTRKPTIGSVKNNDNNHPIISDNWVMVHNGSCRATDKIEGYKYRGEVDSEYIIAWVEKNGWQGLKELGGSASCLFLSKNNPNSIFMWRNSEPALLGYDTKTDTIYIASEEGFLRRSVRNHMGFFSDLMVNSTEPYDVYTLTIKEGKIQIKVGEHIVPSPTVKKVVVVDDWRARHGYYPTGRVGTANTGNTVEEACRSAKANRIARTGPASIIMDAEIKDAEDELQDLVWDGTRARWGVKADASVDIKESREVFLFNAKDTRRWEAIPCSALWISPDRTLILGYDKAFNANFLCEVQYALKNKLVSVSKYGQLIGVGKDEPK